MTPTRSRAPSLRRFVPPRCFRRASGRHSEGRGKALAGVFENAMAANKYAVPGAPAAGSPAKNSSAARRQSCMTRVWCITNYCCLGRMYGRSLLHSSSVRADHPLHNDPAAAAYLPMFSRMSLSIRSIETLFEIFQLIDADGSGEIDTDEFLYFFRMHKSRFAKRFRHD